MNDPHRFREQARAGCPTHAELALSLSAAFGDVDASAVDEAIEDLADLAAWSPSEPFEQLRELGAMSRHHRAPRPVDRGHPNALLLDRTVIRGSGHPDVLAIALVEAGRRLGWRFGVVGDAEHLYVAHTRVERAIVLDPARGELVDAESLPPPIRWRCAHETCDHLLRRLRARFERCGEFLANAINAADLGRDLPLDEAGAARADRRYQSLRARLN